MSFKVVSRNADNLEVVVATGLSTREAADKVCSAATARGLTGLHVYDDAEEPGEISKISPAAHPKTQISS